MPRESIQARDGRPAPSSRDTIPSASVHQGDILGHLEQGRWASHGTLGACVPLLCHRHLCHRCPAMGSDQEVGRTRGVPALGTGQRCRWWRKGPMAVMGDTVTALRTVGLDLHPYPRPCWLGPPLSSGAGSLTLRSYYGEGGYDLVRRWGTRS